MRKSLITAVSLLTAGMMLLGNALAQQTPAAKAQQPPAAKAQPAPAAGSQKAPAAKTGPATKPRTTSVLTLKTQKDKLSYALGMNLGTNLHKETVDVDPAMVLRGLKDALASGKTLLTEDEARAALTQLQTEVRSKQQEKMQVAGEMNKKEGVEFLAANKGKEGVVILPSGLQYKILTEGTGPKWQLFVPSELGYGDRGAGADIGPGATLIFEVELLSIQSKDKPEGAPK